jgi:hypothetical protein
LLTITIAILSDSLALAGCYLLFVIDRGQKLLPLNSSV